MKINELIKNFSIFLSNEEQSVLEQVETIAPLNSFQEREQMILNDLIRKSVVRKIKHNDQIMVVKNDFE